MMDISDEWKRLQKEMPAIEKPASGSVCGTASYHDNITGKAICEPGWIKKEYLINENPKETRQREEGKAPMEYMVWKPLEQVARALKSGADKYGVRNWRQCPIKAGTYGAAIHRHCQQEWLEGVDKDKDTGLHPLAHVIASCLIIMDADAHGCLIDDRGLSETIDAIGDTKS
jgi:hypothetical protein